MRSATHPVQAEVVPIRKESKGLTREEGSKDSGFQHTKEGGAQACTQREA